ncbi:hypothetical protein AZE42_08093 [Rhizopogon vesiculosus]|uniref:Uncharacterized protein n=1 Tax=Rhizopogon vesiculosus TaxID=180088 RepID=A0A1J8PXH1_9AGAM|nr:hypothetical protein AZE42_08093 [Rhizopogon vesiculosus]
MLKPPDLIGHISLSLNLGSSFDAKDVKAREAHEVMMMLPVPPEAYLARMTSLKMNFSTTAFFAQPGAMGMSEASSARVEELEAEMMQNPLGKAKGINVVMSTTH